MAYQVSIEQFNSSEAEQIIRLGEDSFNKPLSQSIDIPRLAEKWSRYAKFLSLKDEEKLAALIVFYENVEEHYIFIPHYVVLKDYRHLGIGHQALSRLISLIGRNHKCVRLEVLKNNQQAKDFYFREGFVIVEENERSYLLEKAITKNMNINPLVAIKCFVYNHEHYLRDCLEGFVMQKANFRFVAIVHDDCSTDNTAAVIREFTEKYPDIIRPIYETENQWHKTDGSLGRIMDEAINATGAKYVAMCEGDDYWTDPYKLQKQVDFMETHPEVGVCYTDYNMQYGCSSNIVSSLFEQHHHYRPETYDQFLLKPAYLAPMTWIYRKELMEIVQKSVIYTDGTYAYMLEFMQNSKVSYIPEVTATYRAHASSATSPSNMKGLFKYSKGVFDTQIAYSEKYPCSDELKSKIMIRGYLDLLPVAVLAGEETFIEEARKYMKAQDMSIDYIISGLKQNEMRRNSMAYRLGKTLLKPFKWLKDLKHRR